MALSVAIRLFDAQERSHLSQIIALSSKRLEFQLLNVPVNESDVVFIRHDEPGAAALLTRPAGSRPLPVIYGANPDGYAWHLPRPATSTNLVPLLQKISATVNHINATPPTPAVSAVAVERAEEKLESTFRPIPTQRGYGFLQMLVSVVGSSQAAVLKGEDRLYVVIDPARQEVVVDHALTERPELLLGICDAQAERFRVVDSSDLISLTLAYKHQQTFRYYSLEEFAWKIAHFFAPKVPLDAFSSSRPFSLKRWPAFTRLKHKQFHIVWSGALMRQGRSVQELSEQEDELAAASFFNACLASALIIAPRNEAKTASTLHQTAVPAAESAGVFSRILKRLRSANG